MGEKLEHAVSEGANPNKRHDHGQNNSGNRPNLAKRRTCFRNHTVVPLLIRATLSLGAGAGSVMESTFPTLAHAA
jgi:hypothetical protein